MRLDELHVELARTLERLANRVRRDLVEHHAAHRHLRLQHLAHVPADRLALAILVGCEDELVGALQRLLQLGDDLLLPVVHDVDDVEVVVGIDAGEPAVRLDLVGEVRRELLLVARQVTDVTDARLELARRDVKSLPMSEKARDGLAPSPVTPL